MELKDIDDWNILLEFMHSKRYISSLKEVAQDAKHVKVYEKLVNAWSIKIEDFDPRWWKKWLQFDAFTEHKDLPLETRIIHAHKTILSAMDAPTRQAYDTFAFSCKKDHSDFATSTDFVGREDALSDLETLFDRRRRFKKAKAVCVSANIKAIGGMGKTALAIYYAKRYAAHYSHVFFLSGQNDLLHEVRGAINAIDSKAPRMDMRQCIQWLFRRWRCGRILFIVDDVPVHQHIGSNRSLAEQKINHFLDALNAFPAVAMRSNVVVTSRAQVLRDTIEQYELTEMSNEDAQTLFESRCGKTTFDRKDVDELVNTRLGGHPLSICLVASYVKAQDVSDLQSVLKSFDTDALVHTKEMHSQLPDYDASLLQALTLNYKVLPESAQRGLLLLSLFRRGGIPTRLLANCVAHITPKAEQNELQGFWDALSKGGNGEVLKTLQQYCFLERSPSSQPKDLVFELHEVVYDYCLTTWSRDKHLDELKVIETQFTDGAIGHLIHKITDNTLSYRELFCLLGIVLPLVSHRHDLAPAIQRVIASLDFCFRTLQFQNYLYDTGVLALFQTRLVDLRQFIETQPDDSYDRHLLILEKFIFHNYYADADKNKKAIQESAEKAIRLANTIKTKTDDSFVDWYRIFILDHHSNSVCKNASIREASENPYFYPYIDRIEKNLPETLKSLDDAPKKDDLFLLLRAAHFWGHRGNQASIFALEVFKDPLNHDLSIYVERAIDAYKKAINYRLAAVITSNLDITPQTMSKLFSQPFVSPWMKNFSLKGNINDERFTNVAQAIGDIAHQYRGIHFVMFLDHLVHPDRHLQPLKDTFEAAKMLWSTSGRRLKKREGEIPLKYQLWMASTRVWMAWVAGSKTKRKKWLMAWEGQYTTELNTIIEARAGESDGFIALKQQEAMVTIAKFISKTHSDLT